MFTYKTDDQNFDKDVYNQDVPVLVDFGAEWWVHVNNSIQF